MAATTSCSLAASFGHFSAAPGARWRGSRLQSILCASNYSCIRDAVDRGDENMQQVRPAARACNAGVLGLHGLLRTFVKAHAHPSPELLAQVGRNVLLSSIVGSTRQMHQLHQDAVAIVA